MSPRAAITACVDSANDSFLVSQRWWTEGQCSERRCSHWCLSSRWASFGPPLPKSCADGKWVPRSHLMTFLWFHSALTKWSCHVNIFFFYRVKHNWRRFLPKKKRKDWSGSHSLSLLKRPCVQFLLSLESSGVKSYSGLQVHVLWLLCTCLAPYFKCCAHKKRHDSTWSPNQCADLARS